MPRVHHVKVARKDNPAVKKGEPYYYWSFRFGGKRYSKTPPLQSQLTQSPFKQGWRQVEEALERATTTDIDGLEEIITAAIEQLGELRDDAEASFEAMGEGLQQSQNGQNLEERQSQCDEWISELESIECEFDYDQTVEDDISHLGPEDEEYDEARELAEADADRGLEDYIENALSEAQNCNPGEPE